jgi:phage antirepressor YoqD-like protein
MNKLKSTTQDGFSGEEWYTIEELAELTGMSVETLKKGNSPLSTFGIDFKVETKIQNMGGHRNVKLYSPNILKALKEYQIKKSVPAATKNKDVALQGNISYIQNATFSQTIQDLLDNPEALMCLVNESSKRIKMLQDKVKEQQPKVDVYNELVERNKTLNFRDMAARLGMRQNEFMKILKSKYIYKNTSGEYRAYADYQKYFTLKTFSRGVDKTGEQLLISMEGITYFLNKYKQEETNTLSIQSA